MYLDYFSIMDAISIIILTVLGVFTVFIVWLIWWWNSRGEERLRDWRSAGWPVVPATVENYEIVLSQHEGFTTVLYYSYTVNGQFYTGQFSARSQGTEDRARNTGDRWLHNKIMVRYKLGDHNKSVYVRKDSQMLADAS